MMNKLISMLVVLSALLVSFNALAGRAIEQGSQAKMNNPLTKTTGVIDRIDHKRFLMVIDDQIYPVDKEVKVHSEFVTHDYFSRLKKGMKINFRLTNKNDTVKISEIWVQ